MMDSKKRIMDHIRLPDAAPGTHYSVTYYRYGRKGARPKIYMQAGLHADEYPPMLIAHHLRQMLDKAAERGDIRGEIILVPAANPLGLAQFINKRHMGRFDLGGTGNFNRNWPPDPEQITKEVKGKLGKNADKNVTIIRKALMEAVANHSGKCTADALKYSLIQMSIDADIVLDLHCDTEALMHMYATPEVWKEISDIGADLGMRAILLAEPSGSNPFDETHSAIWSKLAKKFPKNPIPQACLSVTLEFRGRAHVSDDLAKRDAEGLFRFLQRRKAVSGDPGPIPGPKAEATELDAMDVIPAPMTGIVCYKVEMGDHVKEGALIAEIIDPMATNPKKERVPVTTRTSGLVLSRHDDHYLRIGDIVAHVVGTKALEKDSALED